MEDANSMRILSVNVGKVRALAAGKPDVLSAIQKQPCHDGNRLTENGLHGDETGDSRFHGGRDQAIYVYSANDYDWWSAELNRDLAPGTFGENLTIEGLSSDLNVGDRLISGTVVLEVTGPRIPCHKLGLVMEDQGFPQIFRNAERPGAYCRVLSGGTVRPGDGVSLVPDSESAMTVCEMFRLNYRKPGPSVDLRRALATPLAERLRDKFFARLGDSD